MWPETIGVVASKWVIGVAAVIILIVAWTGVKCAYCENLPKAEPKKKKR
jgi:hypothetical protein